MLLVSKNFLLFLLGQFPQRGYNLSVFRDVRLLEDGGVDNGCRVAEVGDSSYESFI